MIPPAKTFVLRMEAMVSEMVRRTQRAQRTRNMKTRVAMRVSFQGQQTPHPGEVPVFS